MVNGYDAWFYMHIKRYTKKLCMHNIVGADEL